MPKKQSSGGGKESESESDRDREEEISISGSASRRQEDSVEDSAGVSRSAIDMSQRHGQLSLSDGMSNTDVVDTIIATPTEQLIPWEETTLPSGGIFYEWTSGVIKVRAWGANVDKILATQRLAQTGQSIDYMLKECCKFPDGFNPNDLLVGDQIFLLYYLRGITHGNMYEFAVTAPSGTTSAHVVDLNQLASTIIKADASLGVEPFRVDLPYLSAQAKRDIWVSVRFLRVKDSQTITRNKLAKQKMFGPTNVARVGRKRPRGKAWQQPEHTESQGQQAFTQDIPLDDTLTQNLAALIVSVMDDVYDKFKIQQFVDRLHSSDLAVIREWLQDNSPGIETQVILIDPETQDEFPVMLPITESFFRPKETGGVRT